MIDQAMTTRCNSCGVEIEPDEYERCGRCWVHDLGGDCCYRLQCELCGEEEGVEHERDPLCAICIAGAPGIRVFWHAKKVLDEESPGARLHDGTGIVVPFYDMTHVRRIAIETARRIMSEKGEAKDWLGWVIEAVTVDGEHLMDLPFELAMPAQDTCELCTASMGRIAPTDELWTGATATIWSHAKDDDPRGCRDRTVCAACTARANELFTEAAAAEGLGPDPKCDRCLARPEGPALRRIKYKLFSDDPWVASLERIKQQTEQSEQSSDSKKVPWILR